MTVLSIDLETYSEADLSKCGLYAYARHPSTEILLLAYAIDDEPVQVLDIAQGDALPFALLATDGITKTAWNAAFEIAVLDEPPAQWQCSMVHAYYLGLPGSLEQAARILRVKQQKDTAGKALIRYFCKPCKPTKANGGRTRNLPAHDPALWEQFKAYCAQDVETERSVRAALDRVPMPARERRLWALDQAINARGVRIDPVLVDHAVKCHEQYEARLLMQAEILTDLNNPNSVSQLKEWLEQAAGLEIESLNKRAIPEILAQTEDHTVQRVLELRQELAKTSVKKYRAMQASVCSDNRIRGLMQFYGASRTGRWAGRLVQVQNLPRNSMADLDLAREILRAGRYDALEWLWPSVPETLSQLVRTAFVAEEGYRFIVADFSAIEARVIAWLAGEEWVLDVFRGDGKIYEATAAQMFRVPVESITHGSELRQKGKVATLACGYQGGPNALVAMGALDQGLTEDELPGLVRAWREANPHIVQFWKTVGDAALTAVRDKQTVRLQHDLTFSYEHGLLRIGLPSGRHLHYVRPRIEPDPNFGRDGLTYEGQDQKGWKRLRTYGGKLCENITQAVARDCLAEAMLRINDTLRPQIVFHVHDEVVLEAKEGESSAAEVAAVMSEPIEWAPGLPLRAEAYETKYYRKD